MKKRLEYLRRVSVAATFADDGGVTVMLAFDIIFRVAVATPQDQQWTFEPWYYALGRPLLSSRGKTYVVSETSIERTLQIFQMDTPLPNEVLQPPKLIATCTVDKLCKPVYFVECDSEILVIGYTDFWRSNILIYKLADLVMGRHIPVTSIGDKAIFVQDRALCASTKVFPTAMGDTIICIGNEGLAQYDLSRDTWLPAMDQCSILGFEQGPCSLIQHILTCCSRGHR